MKQQWKRGKLLMPHPGRDELTASPAALCLSKVVNLKPFVLGGVKTLLPVAVPI